MALDLNVQPYYDDFNEDKNFHKILYKPGVAVQARELTQSQSILQDQIGKLGKFVLADGSRVSGARLFTDTNVRSVTLVETASLPVDMLYFVDMYAVGATTGLVGVISSIDFTNFIVNIKPINATATNNFQSGEIINIFTTKDLALQYAINNSISPAYSVTIAADTSLTIANASGAKYSKTLTINTFNIAVGDELYHASLTNTYSVVEIVDGLTCIVDKPFETTFTAITMTLYKRASRIVMEVSVDAGIFFTNGFLVKNAGQSIVPNNKTQFPSAVVGFQVIESITDFIDDASLLDPALGSSNYSAPGADRLTITLQLVSKPLSGDALSDLTSSKFIELVRIKKGQIIKSNLNPKLGEIENTLARQLHDHAGNFIVDEFKISFSEEELKIATANTLSLQVSPGKAYVFGHEFDLTYPYTIDVDKARTTDNVSSYTMSTYYGNSISVKDLYGFFNPQVDTTIELHANTTANNISANSKIGTAGIRNFKYVTDNEFVLYLYDVNLSKTQTVANVRSVAVPTVAGSYTSFNFTANTILNTNNDTVLEDTLYQKIIFPYPHENISSISNVEFDTNIYLDSVTFTSNVATIVTSSHTILGGLGTPLSNAIKNQYFFVVAKTTNGGFTANNVMNTDDITITINEAAGTYTATLDTTSSGKAYAGTAKVFYTAGYTNATAKVKTLNTNTIATITANSVNVPVSLGYSDVYKLNYLYKMDHDASKYKGVWSGATQYYADDYVSIGTAVYKALYNSLNSNPTSATYDWQPLTIKVSGFTFNNGQKESYYDHGSITFPLSDDVGKSYVAIFDYFSHGTGSYISKTSYPNDVSYIDIPNFTDKTGNVFKLRDCLDFRPRRVNGSATLTFNSYEVPASTFTGTQSDYSYYLSRIDKLVLMDNRSFKMLKGEPKYKNFVPPKAPLNSLTIATITYKAYGFSEKDINIAYESHKRYTMDDIGKLDKRINRVEYYTSLSLAESDTLNKQNSNTLLASRLKSGFLVDGFTGFAIGDTSNPEYRCAIDIKEKCCRPISKSVAGNLQTDAEILPAQCTNNGIFHLPFVSDTTDSIFASNLQATGIVNCNPFDTISFVGELSLYPPIDTWYDVEEKPVINVVTDDLQGLNNANESDILFDSFSYYNVSTGEDGSTNITQTTYDETTAVTTVINDTSISKTVSDVIQNTAAFCRSIPIRVIAERLSPYTKMYVFINGIMVNSFCSNFDNPLGMISGIGVANVGYGYSSGNTIINFIGANSISAVASANVYGSNGAILGVDITNRGKGYDSNVYITITGSGHSANLVPTLVNTYGNDLITDSSGKLEFTLQIPNSPDLKFRTGRLLISVSDSPLNPKIGSSYAESTFFAKGDLKVVQKTVTSIRPTNPTDTSGNNNGNAGDNNTSIPNIGTLKDPYNCVTDFSSNTTYCCVRTTYKFGQVKPTFATTSIQIFGLDACISPVVDNITMDEFGYCTFYSSSVIIGQGVGKDNIVDGYFSQKVVITAPPGGYFDAESLASLVKISGTNTARAKIYKKTLSADKKSITFKYFGYEKYNYTHKNKARWAVKVKQDLSQFSLYYSGTKTTLTLDGTGNIISTNTIPWALGSNQYIIAAQNNVMHTATAFQSVDTSTSNFVADTQSENFNYITTTAIDDKKYSRQVSKAVKTETQFNTKAQTSLDRLRSFNAQSGTITTVSTSFTTMSNALSSNEITSAKNAAKVAIVADVNMSKTQKATCMNDLNNNTKIARIVMKIKNAATSTAQKSS